MILHLTNQQQSKNTITRLRKRSSTITPLRKLNTVENMIFEPLIERTHKAPMVQEVKLIKTVTFAYF